MADAMKLLPCAFCGADPSVSKYEVDDETSKWAAGCHGDGAPESWVFVEHYVSVHAATKAEVIAAWNRRASPPAREEAPGEGAGEIRCDQCNGDGFIYPNGIGDGHNLQEVCPSCDGAGGFEPTVDPQYAAALRTQAPDSWRPEDVTSLMVEAYFSGWEAPDCGEEYDCREARAEAARLIADRRAALRPQTAESGE